MGDVERVQSAVRGYLDALGWEYTDNGGPVSVQYGSTVVVLSVIALGEAADDGTLLLFNDMLVTDVDVSSKLYRYIAMNQPVIGALSLEFDENAHEFDVFLKYNLYANSLAMADFSHTLGMFAAIADGLYDEIRARFEGKQPWE